MPRNEFGAEIINGFVVIDSTWNTAKTTRVILAMLPDASEYVTAIAGEIGVTEWYAGHYFHHTMRDAFEQALTDYRSR